MQFRYKDNFSFISDLTNRNLKYTYAVYKYSLKSMDSAKGKSITVIFIILHPFIF